MSEAPDKYLFLHGYDGLCSCIIDSSMALHSTLQEQCLLTAALHHLCTDQQQQACQQARRVWTDFVQQQDCWHFGREPEWHFAMHLSSRGASRLLRFGAACVKHIVTAVV